jgi:hypothetical protein
MEALAAHPTLKPVALVADALLDCTARGDLVLDQFAGSGTTILAAEKVGRIASASNTSPAMLMSPLSAGRDRQSSKRRSPATAEALKN